MKNAKSSAFPYDFDEEKHCGLSIREYFAIKCLPVFIKNNLDDNENSYDDNAAKAVKSADALINTLNQTKNAIPSPIMQLFAPHESYPVLKVAQ